MNKTPRELTRDEARERFLVKMWQLVDYWDKSNGCCDIGGGWIHETQRSRLEGLLHSILASGFDGCSLDLPAMEIKPMVPTEDRKYYKEHGENWFPTEDIGGSLHEIMFSIGRKHGYFKND